MPVWTRLPLLLLWMTTALGLACGGEPGPAAPAAPAQGTTQHAPEINREHIFEGEINRRGKPVGFHSRPGGRDPRSARVARVLNGPNRLGVYVAAVEIRDPASGRPLSKRSTFFPDALDRGAVLAAIRNAYIDRREEDGARFRGPSGLGFTIEGYTLRDGTINTAYPLFR